MPIKDLQKRWSRGGKLRIGEKRTNAQGKEYPAKLDYFKFVCDDAHVTDAFKALYGEKPTQLPIMFFDEGLEFTFPHFYTARRRSGIWCFGDGVTATRYTENPEQLSQEGRGDGFEVACNQDCPFKVLPKQGASKDRFCKPEGTLRFLLPELPTVQYFEIGVAKSSLEKILTMLSLLSGMYGRITHIPVLLKMSPFQVNINGSNTTVYGLQLDVRQSVMELIQNKEDQNLISEPGGEGGSVLGQIEPPMPLGEVANGFDEPNTAFTPSSWESICRVLGDGVFEQDRAGWLARAHKIDNDTDAVRFATQVESEHQRRTERQAAETEVIQ